MNRSQRRAQKKASSATPRGPGQPRPGQPQFAEALRLHQAGRLPDAERLYRLVLAADPRHADARHLLGVIAHQTGQNDIAAELIRDAIEINPLDAPYHYNLGKALSELARFDEAVAAYDAAIRINPDLSAAWSNLGRALRELGRLDEAVTAYNTAIRITPKGAETHLNLGNTLVEAGRLDEAATSFTAAIRIRPDYADAHFNLGNTLKDLGRSNEAATAFASTIRLRPDFAEAHSHLGNALKSLNRLDEAVAAYRTAVELWPDYAVAHSNLGNALKDLGRIDEAFAAYHDSLRIAPDFATAWSNLLMVMHYQPVIAASTILETARRFAEAINVTPRTSFSNTADPDRRLRIGYVSGDFHHHPVGYFLSPVLARHDKTAVEVFCYSNDVRVDDMTTRLRGDADHWRSLVGLSDQAAAALIAADGIDILIDLTGHTGNNRLPLFARKPAPVQVSWLGYFGTTGLAAMDYILADRFVALDSAAADFTETIWRMPNSYLCFQPPDLECPILAPPSAQGEPVTFGNFNNATKSSPAAIALWARILHEVPGSGMLLKASALADANFRQSLFDQFASHGIAAERLTLEAASPRAEYLSTYNRVDVALDPTPYGGGTTTAEALWMGVPVVTLHGETWVGRMSESILSTIGLPELVAATADDYVDMAVRLASDTRRLTELRSSLRPRIENSAFCDGVRFARDLECAFRGMWRNWCAKHAVNAPEA